MLMCLCTAQNWPVMSAHCDQLRIAVVDQLQAAAEEFTQLLAQQRDETKQVAN